MRFADITGHGRAKEVLRRCVDRDRIPNAFLFHGPEGVGKRTTALALLSYLVCRDPQEGDSCGACGPCVQVGSGDFVDLHTLVPDKGTIKIDSVRNAMPRLFFEPLVGPWKCLLIDDAHLLSIEAANAALKTLEEPPPKTLFILVTSAPDILPRTVPSRCFPVPFGPLKPDLVAGFLMGRGGVEEH
ncbi:MAG: DNA polymerase III subunit, partial [Deltaproteobacteria bacterium]|nr:DNA polymerase III subunit [Deltaproteobacteria bacterium]